jgi:class 3 adenylate cyclase
LDDEAERHLVLGGTIETHGGALFKIAGDAVRAAFSAASHAVSARLYSVAV